jgi:hypothetical protein
MGRLETHNPGYRQQMIGQEMNSDHRMKLQDNELKVQGAPANVNLKPLSEAAILNDR